MKNIIILLIVLFQISCTSAQDKQVGGRCEGCEALYEYGSRSLNSVDTIPGFEESAAKMKVTGVIYLNDGVTPAKDVILYIYHTDERGIYRASTDAQGWERRHGQHRGWIKTGTDGKYTFYTFRPASYPNTTIPQHIHATVKPPGYSDYYIDDFYFDDDPNLTPTLRAQDKRRAGSGIVALKMENGMLHAQRDIILGLNIPGY